MTFIASKPIQNPLSMTSDEKLTKQQRINRINRLQKRLWVVKSILINTPDLSPQLRADFQKDYRRYMNQLKQLQDECRKV